MNNRTHDREQAAGDGMSSSRLAVLPAHTSAANITGPGKALLLFAHQAQLAQLAQRGLCRRPKGWTMHRQHRGTGQTPQAACLCRRCRTCYCWRQCPACHCQHRGCHCSCCCTGCGCNTCHLFSCVDVAYIESVACFSKFECPGLRVFMGRWRLEVG